MVDVQRLAQSSFQSRSSSPHTAGLSVKEAGTPATCANSLQWHEALGRSDLQVGCQYALVKLSKPFMNALQDDALSQIVGPPLDFNTQLLGTVVKALDSQAIDLTQVCLALP
jgi:hypothetical protein